jgi:hypothetical protein
MIASWYQSASLFSGKLLPPGANSRAPGRIRQNSSLYEEIARSMKPDEFAESDGQSRQYFSSPRATSWDTFDLRRKRTL